VDWAENKKKFDGVLEKQKDSKIGGKNQSSSQGTRREIHCTFRLLNILFSDKFVEDFGNLGNVAKRAELDSRKAANNQQFWETVHADYQLHSPEYDCLQFVDDLTISTKANKVDPSIINIHDWEKLRGIWRDIWRLYRAAMTRFTTSGQHDSDFFNYCFGRVDIYYLRKHME